MPVREVTVFIYLPGEPVAVPAGIFTHDNDLRVGSFAYGTRYLERPNCLAVDPVALPLGRTPKEITGNGGFYGAFRDAAPDYWGRLVIAAAAQTTPEALTEMDFLLGANATRVGNLDFRLTPADPEPELTLPHFNQLPEILAAAESIASGEQIPRQLPQLLRQGTSMGGARPKCTVEKDGSLWIAKFPARGDSVNIPRLEFATMTLAKHCGITVPEMHLVSIDHSDVFLIRRFDREKQENGWCRSGFLSGLSFMQWDKQDRLQWSYPALATGMRRFMSADKIQELFSRMIFNILVRNTDDHPRNHGILFDGIKASLSPAYDIVPSLAMAGVGMDFRLAMSIGDQGREATLDNGLSQAGRFGLSKVEARETTAELVEKVAAWQAHFEQCGFTAHEIDILRPSFQMAAASDVVR